MHVTTNFGESYDIAEIFPIAFFMDDRNFISGQSKVRIKCLFYKFLRLLHNLKASFYGFSMSLLYDPPPGIQRKTLVIPDMSQSFMPE